MKYIKIFEDHKNDRIDIVRTCEKYDITNYTINIDGSIDVDGHVNLYNRDLTEIPLNFNRINGTFTCERNKLTSLKGAPIIVNGNFWCCQNLLEDLEYSPDKISGNYNCSSNKLKTLKGSNTNIGGFFDCRYNNLYTLDGFPDIDFKKFYLQVNPLYEVIELFKKKPDNFIELFNFYEPIKYMYIEKYNKYAWAIIFEVLNYLLDETDNIILSDDYYRYKRSHFHIL